MQPNYNDSCYQVEDGWTCPNCGQYVWWNQSHSCQSYISPPQYYYPAIYTVDKDYSDKLQQIIELLEKLLEKLNA